MEMRLYFILPVRKTEGTGQESNGSVLCVLNYALGAKSENYLEGDKSPLDKV